MTDKSKEMKITNPNLSFNDDLSLDGLVNPEVSVEIEDEDEEISQEEEASLQDTEKTLDGVIASLHAENVKMEGLFNLLQGIGDSSSEN